MHGHEAGELLSLTVGDYTKGWLSIREGKTSNAVRRVPVPSLLVPGLEVLVHGRPSDAFIIEEDSHATGHRRGNLTGQKFLRYRQSIGLNSPKTVLHSLRHCFMTIADEAGCQRHHVQSIVGHGEGRKSVTDIYTRVADTSKRSVVEKVVRRLPKAVAESISQRFAMPR